MLELVVFTGLQAAGKTTFYRARFATTHVHVSKDAWPNARNKERRQRQLKEDEGFDAVGVVTNGVELTIP